MTRALAWHHRKKLWITLFFIFFTALFLRLIFVLNPCNDHHGWRQAQNLITARQIVTNGWEGFFFPVFPGYGNSGHVILELPLVQSLIASLAPLGIDLELRGRIVGIVFSLATMAVFYLWIFQISGSYRRALLATTFFGILPHSVFFGRCPMLEFPGLFLMLTGLLSFSKWCRDPGIPSFWIWTLSLLLLGLIRPHFGVILVPAWIVILNRNRNSLSKGDWFRAVVGVAFVLSCFSGWYWLAGTMTRELNPPMSFSSMSAHLLLKPEAFLAQIPQIIWYGFLYSGLTTPPGVLMFALGIPGLLKMRNRGIILSLLGGVLFYTLLFSNLNFEHTYYRLPAMIPMIPVMTSGFLFFLKRFCRTNVLKVTFVVVFVAVLGSQTWTYQIKLYKVVVPSREFAIEAEPHIAANQKAIVATAFQPQNLLHCWEIPQALQAIDIREISTRSIRVFKRQGFQRIVMEFPQLCYKRMPELVVSIPPSSIIYLSEAIAVIDLQKIHLEMQAEKAK